MFKTLILAVFIAMSFGGAISTASKASATTIEWSGPGEEPPEEEVTFVYGELGVSY